MDRIASSSVVAIVLSFERDGAQESSHNLFSGVVVVVVVTG